MRLPKNTVWKQNNDSDLYGDIWSSFNLDLSSELGKLKTTRTLNVARSVDDGSANYVASLGLPAAFAYYNGVYYAATDGTITKGAASRTTAWGLDDTASKPTTVSSRYSDMIVFNENLYVSLSGTNLSKFNGSAWSTVAITGAGANIPHMMCEYADRLYVVAKAGGINSMNTSETFATTIGTDPNTLQLTNTTSNTITFLRATSTRIWIGTVNQLGGKGHIYTWDGEATSISEKYELESSGAMAAVVKDDVLYVVDNDGRLLAFNGGTFIQIDQLPIKTGEYLYFPLGAYNERWIHPNGMTVKDSSILMLIDNEYRGDTASWEENVPSGIWEWTKETGLYHKYSLSYTNDGSTTNTDFGQNHISIAGALSYIKSSSTASADNGSLLAGAQVFTDASTTMNGIWIDDLNDTVQKFGYFVTPKIFSQTIKEVWQKAYLRIKNLTTSGDEISIWYRTEEEEATDIAITTWSGSNSVRTSTTMSDYGAGDQIEFTRGEGSGKCFQIVSTTDLGSGVTEIKLDGSFTGIDSSGKARLQHWNRIGVAFSSLTEDVIEKSLLSTKNSTWIQFKVCIQNTGNSYIYDMLIANKVNQPI